MTKPKNFAFETMLEKRAAVHTTSNISIQPFHDTPFVTDGHIQLRMALGLAPEEGHVLEFGVFQGKSLALLARSFPERQFHGFDSFEGLPEAWERAEGDTYEKGHFALRSLPLMPPNVSLIKGFFDQTLDGWLARNAGPVALVHIDCDLYGGAKYVLTALSDRFVEGSVVVFDELCDWKESGVYPKWPEGEWRALNEWAEETGFSYRVLSRGKTFQAAIQVYREAPELTAPEVQRQIELLWQFGGKALALKYGNLCFETDAPDIPLALTAIGWNAIKEPQKALEQIVAIWGAAQGRPEARELYELRARVLFKLGRAEEARDDIERYLKANPTNAKAASLAGSIYRRLREYERARGFFMRAVKVGGLPGAQEAAQDCALLSEMRPEFREMKFSGLMVQRVLDAHDFETVLDVGSGTGEQTAMLRNHGKTVTELDYGDSVYFRDRPKEAPPVIVGDFVTVEIPQTYDCVIASHVLEHQPNVNLFLQRAHAVLNEGGVLGLSVPPFKHQIVGGHLTVWNAGLLLYNLVLAGFDCKDAWVRKYGYNISIVVKKRSIRAEGLEYDNGDVGRIARYLPDGLGEGFNGDISSIG